MNYLLLIVSKLNQNCQYFICLFLLPNPSDDYISSYSVFIYSQIPQIILKHRRMVLSDY